jgi:subfamily B ATP-binding cassette protein MsbA
MDAASILSRSSKRRPLASDATSAPRLAPLRITAIRLVRYLKRQRAALAGGFVTLIASAAMEPLLPALFNQLLDKGLGPRLGFPLWWLPAVVIGLFFVRGLLSFVGTYLFAWASSRAVLRLRSDLIQAVMQADASVFALLSPGVAASRVINDPQNALGALVNAATSLLREGASLIALLGYLFYLNWRLTLFSLVTAPLIAWVVRRVQRRVIRAGGQSYESQVRLIGIVDDIVRAWRVVRAFDARDFERKRFADEARRLSQTTLKSVTAGALMTPLTQLVASVGIAIILTMALTDANRGGTTVGEFVAFLTALLLTIQPLRRLTDITQPIVGGLILSRACFDLIDTRPEPDTGLLEIAQARGDLSFERATIVYPGADRAALDGLDLEVAAGQVIALVGPSGAGKSTLVSTLLGFVAPQDGHVRIDGIDIASLRKASLRRQFAVVSQDTVLFDGSIDANVCYAQTFDASRVESCLRAADLWEFVQSLPERGASLVGTNGSKLSGGQRQRLAIARALYKQASIWIFDEATSALDSESEQLVQTAIDRWRGQHTMLLIAHRLSTVRHADVIHVLSQGRIAESGGHADLMARGGVYARMVRTQAMH